MKIVQIANFYTPTSGGLRVCLDEIGRGYLAAGHERVLIVPGPASADEETPSGRRVTVRGPRLLGASGYHILTDRRRTVALLDDLRPDVLEVSDKLCFGWLALWARRRDVRIVLFSHERLDAILRTRVPRGFPLRFAANLANRGLSRLAEQVIVTSRFSAAEFDRIGAVNVRQVPLGVDLDEFRPAAVPPTGDGGVRLVILSRLSREKRPERAIDALRLVRADGIDAELTIVGDGPLRARLEARAAGLPVQFRGHMSGRQAVAALVAGADIALSPSPADTFGLATLEALACGTPVVVTDGAASELIGGTGSGVVCDGTPRALADGVRSLLAMPVATRRAAARAAAERFPWSATVARLLAGYAPAPAASVR